MDECACHILYRFKLLTLIIPLFLIRRNPPPPRFCVRTDNAVLTIVAEKLGHVKEYFVGSLTLCSLDTRW